MVPGFSLILGLEFRLFPSRLWFGTVGLLLKLGTAWNSECLLSYRSILLLRTSARQFTDMDINECRSNRLLLKCKTPFSIYVATLYEGLVLGCGSDAEDCRIQVANGMVEMSKKSVSFCFWPR